MFEPILSEGEQINFLENEIFFGEEDVIFSDEEETVPKVEIAKIESEDASPKASAKVEEHEKGAVFCNDPFFFMDLDRVEEKSQIYRAKIEFGKYMDRAAFSLKKERQSSLITKDELKKKRLCRKHITLKSKKKKLSVCESEIGKANVEGWVHKVNTECESLSRKIMVSDCIRKKPVLNEIKNKLKKSSVERDYSSLEMSFDSESSMSIEMFDDRCKGKKKWIL